VPEIGVYEGDEWGSMASVKGSFLISVLRVGDAGRSRYRESETYIHGELVLSLTTNKCESHEGGHI
jgi:hypothetical protein